MIENIHEHVTLLTPRMKYAIEQWEKEGFEVMHNLYVGGRSVEDCIDSLLRDIKEEEPHLKPLFTMSSSYDNTTYVIVKCKKKRGT